jgi:putative drug exporter of the RND superfamily
MPLAPRTSPTPSIFARWGRFTYHYRGRVLIGWVLSMAAIAAIAITFGGEFKDGITLPGTESQRALALLKTRFPSQAGDSATLVIKADAGVDSPAAHQQILALIADAAAIPEVASVVSPYDNPAAISADRTIAYATVMYDKKADQVADENATALLDLGDRLSAPGLRIEVGGPVAALAETVEPSTTEFIGIGAAMIILLIAFGSIVAMGLPIVSALVGLLTGILGIMLASRFYDLSSFTPGFAALIGLGVGIDYALLVVTRFRDGLHAGLTVEDAVIRTVDTAGRAVTFAGAAVGIAMLGLFAIGIPFVTALGIAASIVVFVSVLVALTLLPPLLAYVGHRVDRWRIPGLHAVDSDSTETVWHRWSQMIQRRPLPYLVGSVIVLLLLAVPVVNLQLGPSDDGNLPTSQHARRAYDLLTEGFGPGFNGPLLFVVESGSGLDATRLGGLISGLAEDPGVAAISPATFNPAGDTAVFSVLPVTSPQDRDTTNLLKRLRASLIPKAVAGTDMRVFVGGATAFSVDTSSKISGRLPFFFATVIGLSMLLLASVFRSIAVPIKAALMNLLSVAATYGILVAVFQWGWGTGLLGIPRTGPIEPALPLMLFAILFGLSMDYEVFLLSRVREEYLRTRDNAASVAHGLASTARVIAAAAAIMVVVFGSFIFAGTKINAEFGLGLAVAILIDATIVRLVLVPATMELLGDWNWWFPSWLDRLLPTLNVDGPATPLPAPLPGD